jgi:phage-related protein
MVRWFADSVAGLRPIISPVVDTITRVVSGGLGALGSVLREMQNTFVTLASAVMPLVTEGIKLMVTPLMMFADLMRQLAVWVRTGAMALSRLFGIQFKDATGSSQGMAATSASTTTTSDLLKRMRESAFGLGSAGKADSDSKMTVKSLDMIYKWLTGELPTIIAAQVISLVTQLPPSMVLAIKDLIAPFAAAMANVFPQAKEISGAYEAGVGVMNRLAPGVVFGGH